MKTKSWLISFLCLLFLATGVFSYRLTLVPPGLLDDEASIGYNAILIGKTLRDETGRKLPVFPLTINGSDWKQPSSVYAAIVFFKFFGTSTFSLRMVSVFTALASLALIIYLGYLLLGPKGAIFSGLIFITTPIVVMHSHLGQENIMPLPFILIWLIYILLFQKNKKCINLLVSGISLGLGIYSYKGMRAIVPPLAVTSVVYLFIISQKRWRSILCFCLGISPFVIIMPWLNTHYAGALFDNNSSVTKGFYGFFYPYLSSFDLSALFIKGDITPWHSTGFHGVFLLSTLPIFLFGLVTAFRSNQDKSFWLFLIAGFFLTPLLFGQVGSVHRFSRLLSLVPFYILFTSLGLLRVLDFQKGKFIIVIFALITAINFFDFIKYYWFTYPVIKREYFGQNTEIYYQKLSWLSREKSVPAYIFIDDYQWQGEDAHFYEAANFDNNLGKWKPGDTVPPGSILMTRLGSLPGFRLLDSSPVFNYFIKN